MGLMSNMASHQVRGRIVKNMYDNLNKKDSSSRRHGSSGPEEPQDTKSYIDSELTKFRFSIVKGLEDKFNLINTIENQQLFEDLNLSQMSINEITKRQELSPEKYKKENEKTYSGFFDNIFQKYSLNELFNILKNNSYPNEKTEQLKKNFNQLNNLEQMLNKLDNSPEISNLKNELNKIKNSLLKIETSSPLMSRYKNNQAKYNELYKKHLELLGKNNEDKYKEKYLKYKLKYLELKKRIQQ